MPLQHVARQEQQDLIAPQDARPGIDDAEPVAVAVERTAEIAAAGQHRRLQLLQVLRPGRIGLMTGEIAVDPLVPTDVLYRQPSTAGRTGRPQGAVEIGRAPGGRRGGTY